MHVRVCVCGVFMCVVIMSEYVYSCGYVSVFVVGEECVLMWVWIVCVFVAWLWVCGKFAVWHRYLCVCVCARECVVCVSVSEKMCVLWLCVCGVCLCLFGCECVWE